MAKSGRRRKRALICKMNTTPHEWVVALEAWEVFVKHHPELGYRVGAWQFHNFLRLYRTTLVQHDAIRLAKNRFWIAHSSRFGAVAFDCATGVLGA